MRSNFLLLTRARAVLLHPPRYYLIKAANMGRNGKTMLVSLSLVLGGLGLVAGRLYFTKDDSHVGVNAGLPRK